MRAAYAYLRVSGDEQADRGLPIAGQREAIERYAAAHGVTITRWFVDEARPGSNDHRDAFQAMMRSAQTTPTPVNAVILWSWSRFARSVDDAHYWKALLRRRGVEVVSLAEPIPDNLPPGMEYVLESVIHWSDARRLDEISHDSRRGQQALARLGFIPSGGVPAPRGYRQQREDVVIEGRRRQAIRWVPDAEWQSVVRRAWRLRLEGLTLDAILAECPGLFTTANGLAAMFRNPVYRGTATFGGTRIPVEPLVTEEEWAAVNADSHARVGGSYSRRKGSTYLLSGLLRCARCGYALSGKSDRPRFRKDGTPMRRYRAYMCIGRTRNHVCDLPGQRCEELEAAVFGALLNELLTEETIAANIAAIRKGMIYDTDEVTARIAAVRARAAELDRAIDGLLSLAEKNPRSERLAERLRQRESERDDALREIRVLEARGAALEGNVTSVQAVREQLCAAIASGTAQPERLRAVLAEIVEVILVDDHAATVRLKLLPFVPAGL